jgi:hypothetical protein
MCQNIMGRNRMRLWTVFKGMARIAKCEQPHTHPSLQRVEPLLEPRTAEPQPDVFAAGRVHIETVRV